jgi:hypothetical protein
VLCSASILGCTAPPLRTLSLSEARYPAQLLCCCQRSFECPCLCICCCLLIHHCKQPINSMSALPAYKKDDESAESQPLWTGEEDINENDDPAPSYPPREASASASGSGSDNPRGSIRYIFQPRWPIPGSEEYALGVLGVDKIVGDHSSYRESGRQKLVLTLSSGDSTECSTRIPCVARLSP